MKWNIINVGMSAVIMMALCAVGVQAQGIEMVFEALNGTEAKVVGYRGSSEEEEILEECIIPEKVEIDGKRLAVTEIGDRAFHCDFSDEKRVYHINRLILPKSLKQIGEEAFMSVEIDDIVCLSPKAPEVASTAFVADLCMCGRGCYNRRNTYVTVPDGALGDYLDSSWRYFSRFRSNDYKEYESESQRITYIASTIDPEGGAAVKSWSNLMLYPLEGERDSLILVIEPEVELNGMTLKVVEIAPQAFEWCEYEKVIVPETVTHVGDEAFRFSKIEPVGWNGVKSVGRWLFYYNKLEELTLPESLIELPEESLWGSFIDRVTAGSNLQKIDKGNFFMSEFICPVIVPPVLLSTSIMSSSLTVYVPEESLEAYEADSQWRQLILRPIKTGIVEAITTDETPAEYYTLQGVRISAESLTPGIYIKRQGEKVEKITGF